MATKSEDVIGAKMDSCLANGAIKLGAGEIHLIFFSSNMFSSLRSGVIMSARKDTIFNVAGSNFLPLIFQPEPKYFCLSMIL